MGKFPPCLKKIALRVIWVAVPVGCVYLWLAAVGVTETIQEIADLSGYDFKVTEIGWSTFAR
jgi:hypothetical protein